MKQVNAKYQMKTGEMKVEEHHIAYFEFLLRRQIRVRDSHIFEIAHAMPRNTTQFDGIKYAYVCLALARRTLQEGEKSWLLIK